MKKIVIFMVGLALAAGSVVVATPASAAPFRCEKFQAVPAENLIKYFNSVKTIVSKKKKSKIRACINAKIGVAKEKERQREEAKTLVPPTVSNLMIVAPSTQEQDYRYSEETSLYSVSWQMPEGSPATQYLITLGEKTERVYAHHYENCANGICTYTKDYLQAPWSTNQVVGVTSVSTWGVTSEMVVASATMPARPKTTVTYTWKAYGNYSAEVPTDSGGTSDVVGYNEFSKTFDRGASISYRYKADAFSFDGEAWCEVLRDGVRVQYERSNGSAVGAYCW